MDENISKQCVQMLVILSLCFLAMVPWVSSCIGHLIDGQKLTISSVFSYLLVLLFVSSTCFEIEQVCEMGHHEVIDDVCLPILVLLECLFYVKVWD